MSGDGPKGGSRRRRLISDEDRALWHHVASGIEPARGKSRVRDVEPLSNESEVEVDHLAPAPSARPIPRHATSPPLPPATPRPRPEPPQRVELERRKARRMARGADEIEARLDLHGLTQADAHAALAGFVRRCHSAGMRTVLVITGKGGAGRGGHDDVIPRPRGVLRHNVPRWLSSPELGPLVVSYATAHIRHGGDGALYVQLRRRG